MMTPAAALPRPMTLAVVGATGAVGRVLLQVLPTRAVVWDRVKLAASSEDVGQTITVGGRDLVVEALTEEFFDATFTEVVELTEAGFAARVESPDMPALPLIASC